MSGFLGLLCCFPLWPYKCAGCGGEQGTDCLSEMVPRVCIAWLPSPLAVPSLGVRREDSSVTRRTKAAPIAYPEEDEGMESVHICHGTGCGQAGVLLQGALAEGCKSPDTRVVVRCQGLSAACRMSLKSLSSMCRQLIAAASYFFAVTV